MKSSSCLLLAPVLAACAHSAAPAPANPLPAEVVLELPGDAEHPASLQTLVEVAQKASGWNFTYTQETADALRANSIPPFGRKRIPAAEFASCIDALLASGGFHCEPIGPQHVHVLLITRRKS